MGLGEVLSWVYLHGCGLPLPHLHGSGTVGQLCDSARQLCICAMTVSICIAGSQRLLVQVLLCFHSLHPKQCLHGGVQGTEASACITLSCLNLHGYH